jgi:hypothetical protein
MIAGEWGRNIAMGDIKFGKGNRRRVFDRSSRERRSQPGGPANSRRHPDPFNKEK